MSVPPVYYNDDKTSFAFATCKERWPIIIGNAISDLQQQVANEKLALGSTKYDQLQKIIEQLDQLREDMKTDQEVLPFNEPSVPFLDGFDKVLKEESQKKKVTWLTGPWLFLECLLYRRINVFFLKQSEWASFDIFDHVKRETFRSSLPGITELLIRYKQLNAELTNSSSKPSEALLKLLFREFIDISLWGNATDLSLLLNATLEDIQSLQGAELRKKSEQNILTNDLDLLWDQLTSKKEARIDFILDNAGFEVFTDLILLLFLLDSGIVSKVIFHCKTRPWMVSDFMIKDFDTLIEDLEDKDKKIFDQKHSDDIEFLINRLKQIREDGSLELKEHEFWTLGYDYWHIPEFEDVYNMLKESDLIVIKGDLNYRKLSGDRQWPRTTPFTKGIGPLNSSGLHLLLLRTCKLDVCLGMEEGKNEELCELWRSMGNEVGELWCSSGKWAVISYTDGSGNM